MVNRKPTGLVFVAVAALVGAAAWPLGCSPSSRSAGGSSSNAGGRPGTGGDCFQDPATFSMDNASGIAVDATSIYWTTLEGAVRKTPLAGGPTVTLAAPTSFAGAIAVDATHVYWSADGSVAKVALGGGPVTMLATKVYPIALAVDATSVYWLARADQWAPEIDAGKETNPPPIVMKVPIGGGAVTVLAAGPGVPTGGFATDDTSVYWVEAGQLENRLMRVNKGGGPPVALSAAPPSPSTRDALAAGPTSVYWVSDADDVVRSVPKEGGAATVLTKAFPIDDVSIAVDATGVYWPAFVSETGSILKVGLQGGPVIALAQTEFVGAMAVGATSLYWVDSNIGGVLKVDKGCGSEVTVGDVADAGTVDAGDGLGCKPSARYTVIDRGYGYGRDKGLVRDSTTGLIWTRYPTGMGTDFCGDPYGPSQTSAAMYCAGIGMRLPTETEALGVAADADPCAWPVPWSIWTSTLAGPGKAWNVSPAGEAAHVVGDSDPAFNVICVWGDCSPPGSCACAPVGASCTKDSACCTHACQGGTCACSAVGAQCQSGGDCCNSTCDADAGGCVCVAPGGACGATSDCCLGSCQGGACVCSPLGAICSTGTLCCSGYCGNGACSCYGAGVPCSSDASCCSGTCAGGTCTCAPAGLPCTDPTDCCSGSCQNGTCQCAPAGTACLSGALCCSGTCSGGACAP